MADIPADFNSFKLSPDPALAEIIRVFGEFPELAAPVALHEDSRAAFYVITAYKDGDWALLPAFTDPGLLNPPFYAAAPLNFLHILFNAPAADIFAFNPPLPGAGAATPEIRLDKKQLSAVIGFFQTPSAVGAVPDFESAAKNEAELGNLHRANYFAQMLMARKPERAPMGFYADILINLGLFQEAYDYAKTAAEPEFFCRLAEIHRRTGDLGAARRELEKVPAGAPFAERKNLELAWLAFEEGRYADAAHIFRKLSESQFNRKEGLFGLGAALSAGASKNKGEKELLEAAAVLNAGLKSPSPLNSRIFFYLGGVHFRAGRYAEAEACYRSSANLSPTVQSKANLCLALVKTGRSREAAEIINEIALVDPNSASRLAAELPPAAAPSLLKDSRKVETSARRPRAPRASAPPAGAAVAASLEAAKPKISVRTRKPPPTGLPAIASATAGKPGDGTPVAGVPEIQKPGGAGAEADRTGGEPRDGTPAVFATLPTLEESRKDEFMGRTFNLAAALEEEFGKKIYFNADGLTEVERKLRLTFMQAKLNPQEALEIVKDSSAFLCYVMQERLRGRLVKFADFDPWGWPMTMETPERFVTYPIQRIWKLLWQENVPEPGWLTNYLRYVQEEIQAQKPRPRGTAAVQAKTASHLERIADAQTEHSRTMILVQTLAETSNIELARTGLTKLEAVLKNNFGPDIRPTADGWKLLRCYGHILAEIMLKDFKASWFNVEGNDGAWSMRLPWKTFIFPLGKVYKAVFRRESLTAYYDALLEDKLRYS